MNSQRYLLLDVLRGMAVILMVFFHIAFDLTHFGYLKIDFSKDLFWWWLPRIIVFLFLLCVGMSLQLSHQKSSIRWRPFLMRFTKLSVAAICITLVTYWLFPKRWIYFGTLHCIAISSLIALPFLKRPKISLLIFIIVWSLFLKKIMSPWPHMDHLSMDYIPLFPWFSIVLLGIFLGARGLYKMRLSNNSLSHFLSLLGRHSLKIYLIHQPLLFGLIGFVHFLQNKLV